MVNAQTGLKYGVVTALVHLWRDFWMYARIRDLEFCYSQERISYLVWCRHTDAADLDDIVWACGVLEMSVGCRCGVSEIFR